MNIYEMLLKILNYQYKSILVVTIIMLATPTLLVASEERPEVKTLRVNNYDMSYVEQGSGEPLILVHGSLSDYRTWLPLLEEFSESNRVIAISLRHYYPERWDGKGSDFTLEQHAEDVAEFINELHVGLVNVLGHSRGGLLHCSPPVTTRNLSVGSF